MNKPITTKDVNLPVRPRVEPQEGLTTNDIQPRRAAHVPFDKRERIDPSKVITTENVAEIRKAQIEAEAKKGGKGK